MVRGMGVVCSSAGYDTVPVDRRLLVQILWFGIFATEPLSQGP